MRVAVEGIVETLRSLPPPSFRPGEVCDRLRDLTVDSATLSRYLHFVPGRYTRNLIHRDETFELLALCWSPGTASPIHNHSGQLCWLYVERGALQLDNFHSLDGPGPGDRIRLVSRPGSQRATPGMLDLQQGEDAIHRVANPFEAPAVSLHVYSLPFDTCLAYDPARETAREMRLVYHSIGGRVCAEVREQRS